MHVATHIQVDIYIYSGTFPHTLVLVYDKYVLACLNSLNKIECQIIFYYFIEKNG